MEDLRRKATSLVKKKIQKTGMQKVMGRICRVHVSPFSQILRSYLETNYLIEVESEMAVNQSGKNNHRDG